MPFLAMSETGWFVNLVQPEYVGVIDRLIHRNGG